MKIAILAITEQGFNTAKNISNALPQSKVIPIDQGVKLAFETNWHNYDAFICIMAAGIVVRCISGLIRSKYSDPSVVVVDENCQYAVSLLSGHVGGANKLASEISEKCGSRAVVTTASDVSGHTALDLWIIESNLAIVNPDLLTSITSRLLKNKTLKCYQDNCYIESFPTDFNLTQIRSEADIAISLHHDESLDNLKLIPRIFYVGIGCKAGVSCFEFKKVFNRLVREYGLDPLAIGGVASIDLKKDEKGLIEFAEFMKLPIRFFKKETLNQVSGTGKSEKVYEKIGAHGVSEPAAILAATEGGKPGRLIVGKRKWKTITTAIAARADYTL